MHAPWELVPRNKIFLFVFGNEFAVNNCGERQNSHRSFPKHLRGEEDGNVHSNDGVQLLFFISVISLGQEVLLLFANLQHLCRADEQQQQPRSGDTYTGEGGFDGWRSCFRRQSDIIRHSDSLFSRWQLLLRGTEATDGGRGCSLSLYDYNSRHNSHCYHGVIKDD